MLSSMTRMLAPALLGVALIAGVGRPAAAQKVTIDPNITSPNPAIWLETDSQFDADNDELEDYHDWRFRVSDRAPGNAEDWDKIGAFCSLLTVEWLQKDRDHDKTFNFQSWSPEQQRKAATTFIMFEYDHDLDALLDDEEEDDLCGFNPRQRGAVRSELRAKPRPASQAKLGITTKYRAGTTIYLATNDHATGIRIVDADLLLYYDPNTSTPRLLPRKLFFENVNAKFKAFLVTKPAR
jgi:hypothetical protein